MEIIREQSTLSGHKPSHKYIESNLQSVSGEGNFSTLAMAAARSTPTFVALVLFTVPYLVAAQCKILVLRTSLLSSTPIFDYAKEMLNGMPAAVVFGLMNQNVLKV